MAAIYEEFERELARLQEQFAAAPARERLQLFLLALEREEIVSVAYRERVIAERIARMPIDDDVRELVRRALIWAWRDEEMHAIYIRGAIFRAGGFLLRSLAYARQMAGAVGGWAASVRQHARWRDAPFGRLAATVVAQLGSMTGKVPRAVRRTLDYGPFRAFCATNVDAERTAAVCWQRIVELTAGDDPLLADFRRIAADELRHQRVFEMFVDAFTDDDRLRAGESAQTLAAKIGSAGDAFLPRRLRAKKHPLGSGAPVFVRRGGGDKRRELRALLDESLTIPGGARVAIKPTFMLAYDDRDASHITDPALVDELALWLRAHGASDVCVIEAPNIYDRFYANRSVENVARVCGYGASSYRLIDASRDQLPHDYGRGLGQSTIARSWRDADFRISFAKMRSHPIELAYLSVANVEWVGGRCDEFLFCERQAQRQTAVMMLLDDFPPHFALIDAFDSAADGLIGAMGCPRPRAPRRLYAGADALAVDLAAARHMHVGAPREASLLRAALDWFGNDDAAPQVVGCDDAIAEWRGPYDDDVWAMLSVLAYPVYVAGSFRGAIFTPEMDADAFPPLHRERWPLRLTRGATRRLLGLHR